MMESFTKRQGATVVQVDARELTNWIRSTNTRQRKVVDKFDEIANRGYNDLQDVIEPISKTSKLINSAHWDVRVGVSLDSFTMEIGLRAPYAKEAMDEGTAPGEFDGKDDWQKLKRWVGITFGVSGKERDKIAFLTARKINQEGTRKYRNKGPKLWEQWTDDFKGQVERNLDEIGDIYIKNYN